MYTYLYTDDNNIPANVRTLLVIDIFPVNKNNIWKLLF